MVAAIMRLSCGMRSPEGRGAARWWVQCHRTGLVAQPHPAISILVSRTLLDGPIRGRKSLSRSCRRGPEPPASAQPTIFAAQSLSLPRGRARAWCGPGGPCRRLRQMMRKRGLAAASGSRPWVPLLRDFPVPFAGRFAYRPLDPQHRKLATGHAAAVPHPPGQRMCPGSSGRVSPGGRLRDSVQVDLHVPGTSQRNILEEGCT